MSEQSVQEQGSYLTPSLEHARVADAMRHGVLSCFPDAKLRAAARTMSLHHIHTIVVHDPEDSRVVGVVSDSDLVSALIDPEKGQRVIADIARRDFVSVSSDQPLIEAVRAMRERDAAHALVVDSHSGKATGMLSTLDVLGVFAWGEA